MKRTLQDAFPTGGSRPSKTARRAQQHDSVTNSQPPPRRVLPAPAPVTGSGIHSRAATPSPLRTEVKRELVDSDTLPSLEVGRRWARALASVQAGLVPPSSREEGKTVRRNARTASRLADGTENRAVSGVAPALDARKYAALPTAPSEPRVKEEERAVTIDPPAPASQKMRYNPRYLPAVFNDVNGSTFNADTLLKSEGSGDLASMFREDAGTHVIASALIMQNAVVMRRSTAAYLPECGYADADADALEQDERTPLNAASFLLGGWRPSPEYLRLIGA